MSDRCKSLTPVVVERSQTPNELHCLEVSKGISLLRNSGQADSFNKGKKTSIINRFTYHVCTIWLLTYSNIAQFIIPETVFGICGALGGPAITTQPNPDLISIMGRWPKALLWIWANTVIFDLSNQRQPDSVREDSLNKKWRPIPAGRLTPEQARRLQLYAVPITFAFSSMLGAAQETPIMYLILWMYNDLGGFDEHYLVRDFLNAIGYVWCGFGIIKVVTGGHGLNDTGYIWSAILCCLVWTTMHIQDLRDQEGDRLINRSTAPLLLGDGVSRWTLVTALFAWSVFCPAYWCLGAWYYCAPLCSAGVIAYRLLTMREPKADELSYKLWGIWLSSMYVLPLCYDHSVFGLYSGSTL